ncbi:MAG: hypothetical protein AAFN93_18550, partial [Bacteroidota bacterium]
MNLKPLYFFIIIALACYSCSESTSKNESETSDVKIEKDTLATGQLTYIELTNPLNETQIIEGQAIFQQRCDNCHVLDTTKLVGPGWAGITNRRSPEW